MSQIDTEREYDTLERRMAFAHQEAAKVWCGEQTSRIEMDTKLAEAFAKILVGHMYAAHLGCATTGELLEELHARCEIDGSLDYSTIPQLQE